MSKVRSNTNLGNIVELTGLAKSTTIALEDIAGILNGNVEFDINTRTNIATVSFIATGVDTRVDHKLGKIPSGYIVVGISDPANLYTGATPWTVSEIYLRSNAIVSQARIMVF